MDPIAVDGYVFRVLMRDLVGHDHVPSAYLVYLHLWAETEVAGLKAVSMSHQTIAENTGLSKSAVQKAIRHLAARKLIRARKESATAVPEYRVLRPWRR